VSDIHLDVAALYAALDEQRKAKNLSWRQVAKEAGVSPSTLTRMGQGKRPDVDSFAALIQWLGVPAEHFIRGSGKHKKVHEPDTLTVISTFLRAGKELTPKSADALQDIISAAFKALRER